MKVLISLLSLIGGIINFTPAHAGSLEVVTCENGTLNVSQSGRNGSLSLSLKKSEALDYLASASDLRSLIDESGDLETSVTFVPASVSWDDTASFQASTDFGLLEASVMADGVVKVRVLATSYYGRTRREVGNWYFRDCSVDNNF